jgi:hypothetical protein
MATARVAFPDWLARLLQAVRIRFLEIDLNEINRAAWVKYVEFYKQADREGK